MSLLSTCIGSMERQLTGWHEENMYGCFLPAVWAGVSHSSAEAVEEVA